MTLIKETKKAPAPKKTAPAKKVVVNKPPVPKKPVVPKKASGTDWDLVRAAIRGADRTLSPNDVEDILLVIKEGEKAISNSHWHWVWDSVKSLL